MRVRINSKAHQDNHKHIWYYNRVGEVLEAVYETDPKLTKGQALVRIIDLSVSGKKYATPDVYDIVDEYELPKELFETLD